MFASHCFRQASFRLRPRGVSLSLPFGFLLCAGVLECLLRFRLLAGDFRPLGFLRGPRCLGGQALCFDLGLFPNPMPGRDQAAVWTQIRRFNPDWVITWNLSAMHVVEAREMKRNGIPMSKLISVNWLNEVDLANIGPAEAGKVVAVAKDNLAAILAARKGEKP